MLRAAPQAYLIEENNDFSKLPRDAYVNDCGQIESLARRGTCVNNTDADRAAWPHAKCESRFGELPEIIQNALETNFDRH